MVLSAQVRQEARLFVELEQSKADSENSWTVDIAAVDQETVDLSVKNPNRKDEAVLREPQEILAEMRQLDEEAAACWQQRFEN